MPFPIPATNPVSETQNVYLLLGSNEGDRLKNLHGALKLLEAKVGAVKSKSAVYETEAWGLKEQNAFLNQAVCLSVTLSPVDLLLELKSMEQQLGRKQTTTWGPRVIDIDILFYGSRVVNKVDLVIPHAYLHERRFTLVPLAEIAADFIHPVLQKTVATLLDTCPDNSAVKLFSKHEN